MFKQGIFAALLAAAMVTIPIPARAEALDPVDVQRFEVYKELAERGDARAQLLVGTQYFLGQGTAVDKTAGMEWVRKAAQAGLAEAQEFLALGLSEGDGVSRNDVEARTWLEKAAVQGRARAQRFLAAMLLLGRGGEKDLVAAQRWLTTAAQQDDVEAMYFLGTLLFDGEFGSADYVGAEMWLRKAFDKGKNEAADYLGRIYQHGLTGLVDPSQAAWWYLKNFSVTQWQTQLRLSVLLASHPDWNLIAIDRLSLAVALAENNDSDMLRRLSDAVTAGDPVAQFSLAVLHELGERGVAADKDKAIALYKQAAGQGLAAARYVLARHHLTAYGVDKNEAYTRNEMLKLEEEDYLPARVFLGYASRFDDFVEKDLELAQRRLELAHQQGSLLATQTLAYMYQSGKDLPRDNRKSFQYYLQAAKAGATSNLRYLAAQYRQGYVIDKDLAAARAWLTLSNRYQSKDERQEAALEDDLSDKSRKRAVRLVKEIEAALPVPFRSVAEPAVKKS